MPTCEGVEEREEDTSSISSVDYYYTEEDEEYYRDEDSEEEEDSAKPISDSDREDFVESPRAIKRYRSVPQLKDWVDSWKLNNHHHRTPFVWVNVYGYYNKDKGYGGYGVILRDLAAKPITASANFSADGKSFFTQVLLGVEAGITLAKKHKLSELCVRLNSIKVPGLIYRLCNCCNDKCKNTDDPNGDICNWCYDYFCWTEGCDLSLVPIGREIKVLTQNGTHLRESMAVSRGANEAAYHLAKMGKRNRRKNNAAGDKGPSEIKPDNFPQELKNILWIDAFHMRCYNVVSKV